MALWSHIAYESSRTLRRVPVAGHLRPSAPAAFALNDRTVVPARLLEEGEVQCPNRVGGNEDGGTLEQVVQTVMVREWFLTYWRLND